jgi:hypothetical protein
MLASIPSFLMPHRVLTTALIIVIVAIPYYAVLTVALFVALAVMLVSTAGRVDMLCMCVCVRVCVCACEIEYVMVVQGSCMSIVCGTSSSSLNDRVTHSES